ncbi:hypothetical protein RHSIM_Rhsim02G0042200 [Rhododendron simsii]|uniref:Uncharacterized protein n=1 Tax=Rhododendron simsii TaxID=118357 RepID=A0A834HC91_RHOSS|nr:hypothetical protein RHSIM_Rhsim02G0042200 [Rhododendron simsii]
MGPAMDKQLLVVGKLIFYDNSLSDGRTIILKLITTISRYPGVLVHIPVTRTISQVYAVISCNPSATRSVTRGHERILKVFIVPEDVESSVMLSIFAHQAPKMRLLAPNYAFCKTPISFDTRTKPIRAQIIVTGPAMDKQLLVVGKLIFYDHGPSDALIKGPTPTVSCGMFKKTVSYGQG